MGEPTAIQLTGVTRYYETGRRRVPALRDVTLSIAEGEYVSIVGPSGCGKSTLLNLIAGIDSPDDGEVQVLGTDLTRLSQNQLAIWRGREVGIVFQFFQLMPTLTVAENVLLPLDLVRSKDKRRERARDLLEQVGISKLANHLPSELSGGEQQRCAVARALANRPRLIVADEPTGNLDSGSGAQVIDLLEASWRAGATLALVTHDPALAARAQRRIRLNDGRVIADEQVFGQAFGSVTGSLAAAG
jgi:putative ABC transport system ATP-binding protein